MALSILFLTITTVLATGGTVTIESAASFSSLRTCAQACICCTVGASNLLGDGMACNLPWPNDCFCQADMYATATSWLSSCVSSSCTVAAADEATSAVSLYQAYCLQAGYTPAIQTPTITSWSIVTLTATSAGKVIVKSTSDQSWSLLALLGVVGALFFVGVSWQVGRSL